MDFLGGASNLMQNRLFQQYLSGAGAAVAQGNPVAQMVNQMSQQNIAAQSQSALNQKYMDMIAKMLSGENVPTGTKLTRDDKGTKIELSSDATKGIGTGTGDQELALPATFKTADMGNINPFQSSQPGISAADLAGLGPQDVSRALSGATSVEALRQQSIINMINAREPLEERFPIELPGVGTISLRQWQSLSQDDREYAIFVHTAKKLGDTDIMSKREFEMLEPTERERFTRQAMEDPELMAATKELATAGATRISIGEKVAGKVAEKKALGKLKGQLYFSDPRWIDDVSKHLSDVGTQREIFMESQREGGDPELMKAEKTVKYIENKISAGKGVIRGVELSEDGRTMIWSIEWPPISKDPKKRELEEIKYAIGP